MSAFTLDHGRLTGTSLQSAALVRSVRSVSFS